MSDWDFLHHSTDANFTGLDFEDEDVKNEIGISLEEEQVLKLSALDSLNRLRDAGKISREQFLDCKKAIEK